METPILLQGFMRKFRVYDSNWVCLTTHQRSLGIFHEAFFPDESDSHGSILKYPEHLSSTDVQWFISVTSIVTQKIQPPIENPRTTYSREVSPGKSSTNGPKWTRAESEVAGNSCAFRVQGVKRLLQKIGSMPKITKKNKSALFVWVQEGSSENRLPQNPPVYHHRRSQNKKSQSGNTSCHLHRNIIIILYNYC